MSSALKEKAKTVRALEAKMKSLDDERSKAVVSRDMIQLTYREKVESLKQEIIALSGERDQVQVNLDETNDELSAAQRERNQRVKGLKKERLLNERGHAQADPRRLRVKTGRY